MRPFSQQTFRLVRAWEAQVKLLTMTRQRASKHNGRAHLNGDGIELLLMSLHLQTCWDMYRQRLLHREDTSLLSLLSISLTSISKYLDTSHFCLYRLECIEYVHTNTHVVNFLTCAGWLGWFLTDLILVLIAHECLNPSENAKNSAAEKISWSSEGL